MFNLHVRNIQEYYMKILSVPQNIVMDLNNVMLKSGNKVLVDIFDVYNHDFVCQP